MYIIDNYSSDDTYRILQKYEKEKGINLSREMDYKKKGEYMTNLINLLAKQNCKVEIFPLHETWTDYGLKKNIIKHQL